MIYKKETLQVNTIKTYHSQHMLMHANIMHVHLYMWTTLLGRKNGYAELGLGLHVTLNVSKRNWAKPVTLIGDR